MRLLIVDDEQPARDRLRRILEEEDEYEVVGEAGNGLDAIAMAARLEPDAVLLDIRMPGLTGIETAHHLNSLEQPPAVVFTTAYDEYAVEAFEARAIGYVLKPVRRKRVIAALQQAAKACRQHAARCGRRCQTERATPARVCPQSRRARVDTDSRYSLLLR